MNNRPRAHFSASGIHHLISCPYTLARNGSAERKHRHIIKMGLALLFHSALPMKFWVEAFSTAVYIINRLPTPLLENKSHFEHVYHQQPAYDTFHVFGCHVYPCLRDYAPNKFSPRSLPCVFLVYSPHHKGFQCFDPTSSRIYISHHAIFDEHYFPYAASHHDRPLSKLDISEF